MAAADARFVRRTPIAQNRMTPRSTSLLSIALAALFLGCGHTYAIWIGPDATVSTLAFGLASKPHGSHPEALNWFGVSTCQAVDSNLGFHERKRIWAVRGWDLPDSSRLIHSIAYGHVPPGFVESVPAQPLSPGCYVASVSASTYEEAEVYFWIDADREVKLGHEPNSILPLWPTGGLWRNSR